MKQARVTAPFIALARRNVVVAPGRVLRIGGLVVQALVRLALSIMMPGVDDFVRQQIFVLLDSADDGTKVCATPTSGRGAGSAQGEPLPAVTLNDDVLRMPLVDSAKRDLMGLVVRFDVLDDACHSLAPSHRLSASRAGT